MVDFDIHTQVHFGNNLDFHFKAMAEHMDLHFEVLAGHIDLHFEALAEHMDWHSLPATQGGFAPR